MIRLLFFEIKKKAAAKPFRVFLSLFIEHLGVLLIIGLFATSSTRAQSTFAFVAPGGSENTEGTQGVAYVRYPFSGNTAAPEMIEQILSPTAFPALPSQGVLLTDISLRPNVSPSPAAGSGTANFQNIDVILSTTTKNLSDLSLSNYGANHGTDRTLVFSGSMNFTIPAPPPLGPAAFSMRITFQQPFYYNPSLGSLVIQINSTSRTAGDDIPLDFISTAPSLFLFQNGIGSISGATPLEFRYVDVPEPSGITLLLTGVALLNLMNRRSL